MKKQGYSMAKGLFATIALLTLIGCSLEPAEYAITFHPNEGSGSMDQQLAKTGETIILKTNTFTRAGYSFGGWMALAEDGTPVDYSDEGELEMGNGPVELYAHWNDGSLHADNSIGTIGPAGGYIFMDKRFYSDGWRYMEAAPSDIVEGSVSRFGWSDGRGYYIDGDTGKRMTTLDSSPLVGKGKDNTRNIIRQDYHTTSAAKFCDDLEVVNGDTVYDDWFLPSLMELRQMRDQLWRKLSLGGFSGYVYWSSSEDRSNPEYAQVITFSTGSMGSGNKGARFRIRAVRMY